MESPIRIYNTLKGEKVPFEPTPGSEIKIYVCGPTVYDEPHIGHARSAYVFDVIRRYLGYKYRDCKVRFVRNVTDVDDKIIERARTELPGKDLNEAVREISAKYLKAYHDDMDSLGILRPDFEPKATDYVDKNNPAMQRFIEDLIKRGAAYVSGGDVYFDIKKAKDYGRLSHQSLDKMESGARITPEENKRDPLDFALWKSAKEGEPAWDSPWGKGRPGWHIECSVMSSALLGDEFDIHGGGLDLIFPHHENEIAQSEGAGKKFARYWIHHGLLTINGQKMAKSLGNFVTVKDFLAKYKSADLLKLFFLSVHYSHPIDYNDNKIEEIRQAQEGILIFLNTVRNKLKGKSISVNKDFAEIEEIKNDFTQAMDDDFNTPQTLAVIFKLINTANKNIDKLDFITNTKNTLVLLQNILGLSIRERVFLPGANIEKMILEREKARKQGNYALSDKIRKELEEGGIILEDTKDGTTWRRKI
jgi:cysteinyl-tRNA synthetase